ncbi:MAG: TIGR03960 family B12-binding radical SAM protein [Clostridia bacterium]|nr:TIGR03960 family B12-binding radical SAM protein [Clostridia bacterium]MBQ4248519.1 TIGR03960 family B12-binding radical SAM protein [Clostridia bacterium]
MIDKKLRRILLRVQKPARYIGNELGSVHKDADKVDVRFAFCFPDTYEVGMSHLGIKILYSLLNDMEGVSCERVFTPWTDMIAEMKKEGIPLFSMESRSPVSEFDIIGFTLQYEMSYSNIVLMLKLAGVPVMAKDRGENDPIVCAGGPCAYNMEPIADFFDFAMMGEGEEIMGEMIEAYREYRREGLTKAEYLRRISHIEGVYVPSLYDVSYNDDGTVKAIEPKYPDVPRTVKKRIIDDFDKVYTPRSVIVPNIKIVHDRVNMEVFRGCLRGCRFCQAGMIYRPVREKSVGTLMGLAHDLIAQSGYEEISLASLSTSDYSHIDELLDRMLEWSKENKINFAIPSQRADQFTKEFLDKTTAVRTSGITFAPEAGSQRLRDVINKNISEEQIINACEIALTGSNTTIKLYFMSGLPTETMEDIDGIGKLAFAVLSLGARKGDKPKKSIMINVSVSAFVPKPFTPFQWMAQDTRETMREKHVHLKSSVRSRKIHISYSDDETSHLEAVFARGDRRLSKVILHAVEMGCMFDSWGECFDFEKWMKAFADCGVDPAFYANRARSYDETLPWDHIDVGVSKRFLMRENELSKLGKTSVNCRDGCAGCGIKQAFGGELCGAGKTDV